MRSVLVLACLSSCGFQHGRLTTDDSAVADVDAAVDTTVSVTCPPTYTLTISSTTSRYRVIDTIAAFAPQHQACNNDQPGHAHLASVETAAEASELRGVLVSGGLATNNYYIGAVQQPGQASTTTGWFVFTGAPLPDGLWAGGQPNDDISGENGEENLAALNPADLLHDVTGDLSYPAICECDGLPIDPTVAGYIP